MILLAAVLQLRLALVLPIEFKINISAGGGHGQVPIGQLDDLLLDLHVVNALELWVPFEVGCNDFDGHLDERLDVVGGESVLVLLASLADLNGDLVVIELLHLFHLGGMLLCLNFLGLGGSGRCEISLLHFNF